MSGTYERHLQVEIKWLQNQLPELEELVRLEPTEKNKLELEMLSDTIEMKKEELEEIQ